jgi:hypothetical protein
VTVGLNNKAFADRFLSNFVASLSNEEYRVFTTLLLGIAFVGGNGYLRTIQYILP